MFETLQEVLKKYGTYSVPMKLLIGIFIGVIGGPGLLTIIGEYATYVYAIRHGVRAPAEGVDYLRPTITLLSILLPLASILVFSLTHQLAGSLLNAFIRPLLMINRVEKWLSKGESVDVRSFLGDIKRWPAKSFVITNLVSSFTAGTLVYFVMIIGESPKPLLSASLLTLFFVIAFFTAWRQATVWWVAAILTVGFYVVTLVLLFNLSFQSQYLRLIGYGGGMPIAFEVASEGVQREDKYEAYLFLKTKDHIVAYFPDEGAIYYPNSRVRNLRKSKENHEYNLPEIR